MPAESSARLAAATDRLRAAAETVRSIRVAQWWRGEAAEACADRLARTAAALNDALETMELARKVLVSAALLADVAWAAAERLTGGWRLLLTLAWNRPDLYVRAQRELADLAEEYSRALIEHARLLSDLGPVFGAAGAPSTAVALPQRTVVPSAGTDPARVARWWQTLTEDARRHLLVTEFDRLGVLSGLPARVLDSANRRRIASARLAGPATARAAAEAVSATLAAAERNALREGLPTQEIFVLSYAPGPAPDGTLVAAFGDPDTAAHVAITVPGTGAEPASDFTGPAAAVRAQMGATEATSAIAWLGYRPPRWADDVTSTRSATEGAPKLIADVGAYRAAAAAAGSPRQHITVIGHSYGGTMLGYAGREGADVDDIVFVGSPGSGVLHAAELSAGQGHVWAGGNEHDPVIQVANGAYFTGGPFAAGPHERTFGAHQFRTDSDRSFTEAHEAYFDRGSQSLRNIGHIATGDYAAVQERPVGEAPIAPGGRLRPGPSFDLAPKVLYEGRQVVEDVLRGDLAEAGRDLTDLGLTVVAEGIDTLTGTAKAITDRDTGP